jgi:hypothetical protein
MSTNNTLRLPTHFTDENGRACVRVPLARCTLSAILYAEDYDRLIVGGISANWSFNYSGRNGHGYVRVKVPGANTIVVARLVAGASFKRAVRYRHGNPLDLRLDNLRMVKGGRSHKDCLAMLATEETAQKDAA